MGTEHRLKQQCFWTAASLIDIMRRFTNLGKPVLEFSERTCCGAPTFIFTFLTAPNADVAIRLNDVSWPCTHRSSSDNCFRRTRRRSLSPSSCASSSTRRLVLGATTVEGRDQHVLLLHEARRSSRSFWRDGCSSLVQQLLPRYLSFACLSCWTFPLTLCRHMQIIFDIVSLRFLLVNSNI